MIFMCGFLAGGLFLATVMFALEITGVDVRFGQGKLFLQGDGKVAI